MPEKLIVVDAYSHIYQAFYAIRGLTAPDGKPVNAVYGFARTLKKLRDEFQPEYIAVAFDGPQELERKKLYDEYKANRDPMPESLVSQIPLIREMLGAQGIPVVESPGYEADDVLAALAEKAAEKGLETIVVTTDKDAEQVIDENTSVLHVHKDREVMLDPEALMELKGIEPWQVVEMMALCGDSTDNIPGVPGVGPKTALKLVRQFGSVENLYANLDEVKGKLHDKLAEARETVALTRELVRLYADIPLNVEIEDCRVPGRDTEALRKFFRALGFNSLLDNADPPASRQAAPARAAQSSLFGEQAPVQPTGDERDVRTVEKDYEIVDTVDGLRALAEVLAAQEAISVDLETTSLEPRSAEIVGFAFSWKPDQGAYVPTLAPKGEPAVPAEEAVRILRPVLEAEAPGKLGQNLKYDIAVLMNHGVTLGGLACDSMVASYLLHPSRRGHGLDALALRHLNYRTVKISELIGKGAKQVRMDEVPVAQVGPYACEDADVALQLCRLLEGMLVEQDLDDLFRTMELRLVPVLAAMEWTGVKVDTGHLRGLSDEFAAGLAELEESIYAEAGHEFNVNSPSQVSDVLFEEMNLPAPRGGKRTTGYSTAAGVLEGLRAEHPIADLLLRHRELSKLKSTYADALLEMVNPHTGRIHTSFNQTVTATGRLSSSDPNLQNIPVRTELGRRIRRAFVAGEDDMSLLGADYSQVELRVLAHCSGDPALKGAFERDEDIHSFVAAQVNDVAVADVTKEMRQKAKAVNFGIVYGQSPYGLSRAIDVPVDEAEAFIAGYFDRYPKVREFIGRTVSFARRNGYVQTLAGRKRAIEGINGSGATRAAAERIAVNTVIQGSAADLIKLAMLEIHAGLPAVSRRARMLMQIHDELVFEAPDDDLPRVQQFVREKMVGALELDVRLKVDFAVAKNWADAK